MEEFGDKNSPEEKTGTGTATEVRIEDTNRGETGPAGGEEKNRERELGEARNQVREEASKPQTAAGRSASIVERAREELRDYERIRVMYEGKWKEWFGHEREKKPTTLAQKGLRSVSRWFEDRWQRLSSTAKEADLKKARVEVAVEERDGVTADFERGLIKGENAPVYEKFLTNELCAEANATHWLRIKGLTKDQFHMLVRKLGQNPQVFGSDDRGENGGRLAIDNALEDGQQPFGINTEEEKRFWQPVFPGAPRFAFWSRWRESRTHGVIYKVKNEKGEDELLLPVHVDPKNGVAIIGELLRPKKKDEHGALDYHQTMSLADKNYTGTGLYDLGCKVLIHLLRNGFEKQGLVSDLKVTGEEKLLTSGSIVEDDKLSWEKSRQWVLE